MKINISEVFYSTQGEGKYIGTAQVFIRLSQCPFSCPYCDTDIQDKEYFKINNKQYNNPVSAEELSEIVLKEFGVGDNFHSYSITGGEPLIHYDFVKKLAYLLKNKSKAKLFLETSGLITKYFQVNTLSRMLKINFMKTGIKSDYFSKENAKEIIDYTAQELNKYNIKNIIIQPVDSIIAKDTIDYLYNMYYSKNIEARIIPQTHKILAIP